MSESRDKVYFVSAERRGNGGVASNGCPKGGVVINAPISLTVACWKHDILLTPHNLLCGVRGYLINPCVPKVRYFTCFVVVACLRHAMCDGIFPTPHWRAGLIGFCASGTTAKTYLLTKVGQNSTRAMLLAGLQPAAPLPQGWFVAHWGVDTWVVHLRQSGP